MKRNKILRVAVLGLAMGVTAITATKTVSQTRNCGDRATIIQRLADGFGETRQSIGIGSNNAVVEVFASADSGTWTITVTAPSGLTCLVASGRAFETLVETLPAKGNDA